MQSAAITHDVDGIFGLGPDRMQAILEEARSMRAVIFLIGAGASVDAGMPSVAELTRELRDRLPYLRGMNGKRRCEFAELFDALAEYEPEIRCNYEKFFEWLSFLQKCQTGTFRKAVRFKLDQRLVDAVPDLAPSIKKPVWEILSSRHQCAGYAPGYFAKLGAFLPDRGRLKVFTTNYDLCIECACRHQDIDVTTGFRFTSGPWRPSLFRKGKGINLYKLHGSLNWGLSDNWTGPKNGPLVERYPPQWDKEPELILGPGSKPQPDDPYAALYAEFHQAIRGAKACVAIGCGFRDDHIKEPIQIAVRRGMNLIDVNPSPMGWALDRYTAIRMGARQAFESGEILKAIRGSDRGHK